MRAYEGMPAYYAGYNDCKEDILKLLIEKRDARDRQLQEFIEDAGDLVVIMNTRDYQQVLMHLESLNYIIKTINTEIKDKTK